MPGRTGRRPLPSEVKRAHGETRPSRLNPREPRPTPGAPVMPRLSTVARAEWTRIAGLAGGMKVLTVADGPILEATVYAYEEMVAARAVLDREGRFYSTETATGAKMKRVHPAVAVGADAWRRYVIGLGHFGLSPAARGKVATAPEVERDEVALWLVKGGERGA